MNDELWVQVYTETKRLCEEGSTSSYEEFEELIELRQTLVDQVEADQDALSDIQKRQLRTLLELDPVIMGHMVRLRDEAEAGLNRLQTVKKQRAAYQTDGAVGSFMYDKRK